MFEKLFGSSRRQKEDAFLQMARVEYRKEYVYLSKTLGREPTGSELMMILKA